MARKNPKVSNITVARAEGKGITLLERTIAKGKEEYRFYDVKIGEWVIIKDCRVCEGKRGRFIGTPSRSDGSNYYPQAYLSDEMQSAILTLIDNDDAWELTDDNYLTFADKAKEDKPASNSRGRGR